MDAFSIARELARGTCAIARGVVDVRREPAADAEVVTQALLHRTAEPLEQRGDWVCVRLSDYEGWVRANDMEAPADATEHVAVVQAPRTPINATAAGGAEVVMAYATSLLPLVDGAAVHGMLRVALPGGRFGWVAEAAVTVRPAAEPLPMGGPDVALALAMRMLGVPYLWGGTTVEGLDCSGFAQLCCRAAGRIISRDADQQYNSLAYVVARGDLSMGDLVFFARDGVITHVALMLDGNRYIHAKGAPEMRVMINSFAPHHEEYSRRLDERYAGARRPFADGQAGTLA